MKIFIVIDEEASPKDAVHSLHVSEESALKSEKEFKEMIVGGKVTMIVEKQFNEIEDFVSENMWLDDYGRFLIDAEGLLSFMYGRTSR